MSVTDLPEHSGSASDLDGLRDEIASVLNKTAIEVGDILIRARYAHPGRFTEWVERELPFSMDKARNLMAVSRAFRTLPPDKRELLPAPWLAMFTLAKAPLELVERGIESGEVNPQMTNRAALALVRREPAPAPRKHRGGKPGPPKGARNQSKVQMPASLLVRELLRYTPDDLTPTQRTRLDLWLQGDFDDRRDLAGPSELHGDEQVPVLP